MVNKTFQIKLSHLIISGIFLLLIIFLIFFRTTPTLINTYDKEKKEIDSLQNETNKLKNINVELGSKIYLQDKVIDSLNKKIKITEKELKQTRIYYGKKIKDISSSSPSELNKFFTERYK
jgi:peptidoglycan hydrolase CwlO-like protein